MLYYNEFATDLTAVIQFAKNKYPKNKTGVWAFSMGTIIATLATNYIQPDFIIGDGYVTNPLAIKAFYAKKNVEILLPSNVSNYINVLKNIKLPMLIFSGKKDEITTDNDIQNLKKIKPAIKVVSFKGGHMQGFEVLSKEFPGSEYISSIEHFLKLK